MTQAQAARLARIRRLSRASLLAERLLRLVWPAACLLGLYLCAALFGLLAPLPRDAAAPLLLAVLAVASGLILPGLRRLRWPGREETDRRIEARSGLLHAPLAALSDERAAGDDALWAAHRARQSRALGALRAVRPAPRLARADRFALRGATVVTLVAAIVIAGPDAPGRLRAALLPPLPLPARSAQAAQVQAWVIPPAYTALPPVFLSPAAGTVSVPAGAQLTVDVLGDQPTLSVPAATPAFRPLDANDWQAEARLSQDGMVSVRRHGATLAAWRVTVAPDAPPHAAWTAPPAARGAQTRLPWSAGDDHGVVGLRAEIALADRPDAPAASIPVTLPGEHVTDARGVESRDLTTHPFAGLRVRLRLVARDALGQEGASDTADLTLPERQFRDPAARTLMAARKMLTLHPEDRRGPADEIERMLTDQPEAFGQDAAAWVETGALLGMLQFEPAPSTVPDAQAELLALALRLEEAHDHPASRGLDAARQAARDALDQAVETPDQAHRDALDDKIAALRQAIDARLAELSRQARDAGNQAPPADDQQVLHDQEVRDLADAAQQAAREGRLEDAQKRMAELERMLDRLRDAKPFDKNAPREHGALDRLRDLSRQQNALADRAQQRASAADPRSPADGQGRANDHAAEDGLRRALDALAPKLADPSAPMPWELAEAAEAMRAATRALAPDGSDRNAAEAERHAADSLRAAHAALARQRGQASASEEEGEDGTSQSGGSGQDGLGRPDEERDGARDGGTTGVDEGDATKLPTDAEQLRARAVRDELRRRGAERTRPAEELDYIDRLLRPF